MVTEIEEEQMIGAQQIATVSPGQLTSVVQPSQLTTAPGVAVSSTEIGDLLSSVMPLVMIMMVFMMLKPMMSSMAEGFQS